MQIYNIFSKRQKKLRGEVPDVYQYKDISNQLRVQIFHIISDAMGRDDNLATLEMYKLIHDVLCREYGKFSLLDNHSQYVIDYIDDFKEFILRNKDINQIIDVVELSFRLIDELYRKPSIINSTEPTITPDEAIEELNFRLREHGVGYQYESGEIIRIDSQIIHAEVVKPVLNLLSDTRFKGANEEFLKAHEHYRHGCYKECLVECLKAFESTIKTICDTQGWIYQPGDTAKKLINVCF